MQHVSWKCEKCSRVFKKRHSAAYHPNTRCGGQVETIINKGSDDEIERQIELIKKNELPKGERVLQGVLERTDIFRPSVIWYEDLSYEAFDNYVTSCFHGLTVNITNGHVLAQTRSRGYMQVPLGGPISVARLVLSSWRGKPNEDDEADHVDPSQKTNDSLKNLRWLTEDKNKAKRRFSKQQCNPPIIAVSLNNEEFSSCAEAERQLKTRGIIVASRDISLVCRKNFGKDIPTYQRGGIVFVYDLAKLRLTSSRPDIKWRNLKCRYGKKYKKDPRLQISKCGLIRDRRHPVLDIIREVGEFRSQLDAENGIYPHVSIQGERREWHEIACTTFHGRRPDKQRALHKNDNVLDISEPNMRWGTCRQNGLDAHTNGRHKGSPHERQPVTIQGVEFESLSEAAKQLGFGRSNNRISIILKRVKASGRTSLERSDFARCTSDRAKLDAWFDAHEPADNDTTRPLKKQRT